MIATAEGLPHHRRGRPNLAGPRPGRRGGAARLATRFGETQTTIEGRPAVGARTMVRSRARRSHRPRVHVWRGRRPARPATGSLQERRGCHRIVRGCLQRVRARQLQPGARRQIASGWASQHFGGDGACAGFNGCLCQCLATAANPATCALSSSCQAMVDPSCLAALQAAQKCLARPLPGQLSTARGARNGRVLPGK
jgi:hypothetical protein